MKIKIYLLIIKHLFCNKRKKFSENLFGDEFTRKTKKKNIKQACTKSLIILKVILQKNENILIKIAFNFKPITGKETKNLLKIRISFEKS